MGDRETLKVQKQGSPCAAILSRGETGQAWSSVLFRTFVLDLKALLPSPTIAQNLI